MLQYTQITIFHVIRLAAVLAGGAGGGILGAHASGGWGMVLGTIGGAVAGHLAGASFDCWLTKRFFRNLEHASNDELWRIVNVDHWNLTQTLALLYLAGRGENVRAQLPRILSLLESDNELTRVYCWDALRLVFDDESNAMAQYDPRGTANECQEKVARLRKRLSQGFYRR